MEEDGVNIIAANVSLNLTRFLEDAETMMTNFEAINLKLKEVSMITINPMMNMGAIDAALAQRVNGEAMTDAQIVSLRERTNAEIMGLNSQRIMGEAESIARINLLETEGQLFQSRILTEGMRQRRMIEAESLASSQTYFGKMTTSFKHHLGLMASMAVMYGGFELFKEGIVDFEKNLAGVEQVLEETYKKMGKELSPEVMAAMGENFSVIAERWGQSVQDILAGAKDWGRQYKELNTIQELVNSSTLLSVVDNLSLTESVKGLEATMNQYGLVATTAAQAQEYSMRIVDSWSAVAHKSMISALDLAQGNEKAASSARMVGVDFDNLQGLLAAAVRATGRTGNELGNTLKTMFASIHSDKAVSELHKLGVEVKDLEGNFRPAQQVFADLMIAMAGTKYNVEEVVKSVSSGKFQWSKAASILGDYDTYIKATAQSINSAGLAQEYMAVQMDTVSRKAGQLHQALIALTTSAGNSGLTGALKSILDNLRYFIDGLNNGGMKAVAFGVAIVGLAKVTNAITTATRAARVAQEEFNLAIAVGDALTGNFVGLIAAAAVLGVGAYTIGLGKAADAQTELTEKQKQDVELHKQMSDQYGTQIKFLEQLEEQHGKLSKMVNDSSKNDEQKAKANKDLQATEEALSITVGDSTSATIKNANYTHDAFQSVVTSLKGKQDAEKIAWQNSSKLVNEATINLQKNVQEQIAQVQRVSEAYTIFGKIQETFLAAQKWTHTVALNVAQFNIDMDPSNEIAKEGLKEAKDKIAADETEISQFYLEQRKQKLNELYAESVKIGNPFDPSIIQDIPTGPGFNSEPMDSTKTQTAKQLDDLAKKYRELQVAMADNKIRFYTDDVKMLDAQMKNSGENLVGLIAKETDYSKAVIETRNERTLIQSQIKELSVDTAKYAEEIENLKKKDMDLAVQEQELITKQVEMLTQQKKRAFGEKRDAELALVDNKIKDINDAKKSWDDYYDSQDRALNAELKAFEDQNTLLDEQNQLLTLRNNLTDLNAEKSNIESEKSVRVMGADGKWTYQSDQGKLNDVNKRITDAQKAVDDQLAKMAQDAQKKALQDQINSNRESKRIADEGYQNDLDTWNRKKEALNLYWKNVLDDTKINQAALIELTGKGYAQSLTDADKYYSDAKKALDRFGADAMLQAQKIHDSIAASLAIASSAGITNNNTSDNSIHIGEVSGSNLVGVLAAARQLASM